MYIKRKKCKCYNIRINKIINYIFLSFGQIKVILALEGWINQWITSTLII